MIRRPPRSTLDRSSAASDVYKRQHPDRVSVGDFVQPLGVAGARVDEHRQPECRQQRKLAFFIVNLVGMDMAFDIGRDLSLIHISEPTRPY